MKRIGLLVLALLTVCGLTLSGVPALPAAAQPAPPSAQAVEELATKGLTPVAENAALILYADSATGNAALYHKAKGVFWYTNPPEYLGEKPTGQEKVLASAVCQNEDVLAAWEDGSCDVAVLPFPFAGAKPFLQEQLFVCVPPEHALAKQASLTFAEINGFNFLLRSELGFWDTLCREKMPASKFLVQTDTAGFDELVNASSLPCFTTDYGQRRLQTAYPGRVNIPLTDTEASVTFFLASRRKMPGL